MTITTVKIYLEAGNRGWDADHVVNALQLLVLLQQCVTNLQLLSQRKTWDP